MRRANGTLLMLGLAAAGATTVATQQSTFRGDIRIVSIFATVLSSDGRLVPDLAVEDFEVLEDGKPVPIAVFSNAPQPLSIALLLDTGLGPKHQRGLEAAHAFIDALVPVDVATYGTFDGAEEQVNPWLTNNRSRLHAVIDEETWPTILYGAGGLGPREILGLGALALRQRSGQRALLVMTGGAEHSVFRTQWRSATDSGFVLYVVRIDGTPIQTLWAKGCLPVQCRDMADMNFSSLVRPGSVLHPLAESTGGGHFTLRDADDAAAAMARVADELRHPYVLGFPTRFRDGKSHTIAVRVRRDGVTVRARSSYLATP